MHILIIGNGGREHAIAWKVAQNPAVKKIFVAPGNAGTELMENCENIPLDVLDFPQLIDFAKEHQVDLTIVGPELALANGIVDAFEQADLACFGPRRAAAELEASKIFSKAFMNRHKIPTAKSAQFADVKKAMAYLKEVNFPIVIKADGLAAGKGVVIAETLAHAEQTIEQMLLQKQFGEASKEILIEEFLRGEEASFIVITDGETIIPLASAQDHKARDDGGVGPNTGGMGAYSPAPIVSDALEKQIMSQVIEPTVKGMAAEGKRFCGFLYAGLMIDAQGHAKVLEYNCRLGDPETQAILFRLKSDLIECCQSALNGQLNHYQIQWDKRPALTVVMASEGYPGSYQKGKKITGLSNLNNDDVHVFHAGTKITDGDILTNGGRVLAVTALGKNIQLAQENAYNAVKKIDWQGKFYRQDIGHKAL